MSDENNNGIPDSVEAAVSSASKIPGGKAAVWGATVAALLATGGTLAAQYENLILGLARSHINAAVSKAVVHQSVILNAYQNSLTCYKVGGDVDHCDKILEDGLEDAEEIVRKLSEDMEH